MVCNQYPVRKLIAVGDTIEVIYLWKDPTNGVPPVSSLLNHYNKI